MKTIEEVEALHGAQSNIMMPSGSRAIRDAGQSLWFYYRWNGSEYRVEGSTKTHPKFNPDH